MDNMNIGQELPSASTDRSPFASEAHALSAAVATGSPSSQGLQPSQAASPASLPQTQSRLATGQGFRSSASWFNRTTNSASGSDPKHSLLAMVPSQPLTRPTASAPPSPASQLQPPTIPVLDELKQPEPASLLGAPASMLAAPGQLVSAAQPGDQSAEQSQQPKASINAQGEQQEQQEANDAEASESKQAKRDKRLRKTEANMRWQLMRKLADISADVELLNHEVARIRYKQSTAFLAEEQRDLSEQEEQQLEALQQKRLADLVARQCTTSLKSVLAHKWAFPFAKPVDIHLFKEYPNIIQHPMDFATIKAKVDSGAYQGPQQFYDDVKLVFANARQFNPPGSDVNLMASGVEEKFEERWQALLAPKLAEEQTLVRTDAAAVRKQRMDHAQARLAGELERHRVRLLSVFDNLHSRIMDAKTLAAAACKPVSQQDKEALLPALDSLTPEHFEWAMSLVHARYPGLPTGPGEEMQFDITCLDSLALRQLMDLTQACARAAKMAEGGEIQVTWPANPVGVGSRGHKPNKRARRSPTPPTPLSAHPTAKAPSVFPAASSATADSVLLSQSQAQVPAQTSKPIAQQPSTMQQLPISQTAATTAADLLQVTGAAPAATDLPPSAATQQADVSQSSIAEGLGPSGIIARIIEHAQSGLHVAEASTLPSSSPQAGIAMEQMRLPETAAPVLDSVSRKVAAASAENQADAGLPASVQAGPTAEPSVATMTDAGNKQESGVSLANADGQAVTSQSEARHHEDEAVMQDGQSQRGQIAQQARSELPLSVADFTGAGISWQPVSMDIGSQGVPDIQAAGTTHQGHMQQSSPVAAGEPRHHSVPTSLAAAQDASRPSPLREVSEQPAGLQSTDTEPQLQQLVHQPAQNQTGLVSQAQQQQQQQPSAAPQEYKAVSSRHDRPSPEAQEKDIAQLDAMEPHHDSLDARRSADGDNVAPGAQEQTALSEVTTLPASQHAAEQQEEEDSQEAVVDHPHAQDTVSAATNGKQESSPEDDAEDTARDAMQIQTQASREEPDPASAARRSAQLSRRRQAPQRRTTPTPLASKAAGTPGRKAAGRGGASSTGKSRASTPAARTAAMQKPRRSTSRSTAGKRRRSPS